MILIIGGASNGKLDYVKSLEYYDNDILNCAISGNNISPHPVIYKLNAMIKSLMEQNIQPTPYIMKFISDTSPKIIICDEVGSGVVPMERFDRDYREEVGRLCCHIAQLSDTVIRVYAGIPTAIKGNLHGGKT